MSQEQKVNILRELGTLDAGDLNTMALAAHAYRAGVASGYEKGRAESIPAPEHIERGERIDHHLY